MIIQAIFIFILYSLIFGVIALLVYWDASSSGMENPTKWAAFVFLFNGIGFILYISEKDNTLHDEEELSPYSLAGKTKSSQEEQRE